MALVDAQGMTEDFDADSKPPQMCEPSAGSNCDPPRKEEYKTASKSKAQKQREYRQRIKASRTPAQAAAARKSKNERQRNYRLRQAANLAIASNSLGTTTTSPSRSGEELNNVQTRSQRQHAQQQSTTTADQPDERVNLTNEPLFPGIPVPMEVQEVVASTSATLFAKPKTAARKSRAQIQREYRQRMAASKTPAQAAAAREARNVRDRNNRLRQAANLVIASGSTSDNYILISFRAKVKHRPY
ncbi:jg13530 [Pararge aegeria aegeria]|uniref:Jg13530 protein n=1 Tax=Pararge aegeria aegeria TaxID=348720 RepID=A0A8S4QVP2_9NEOP|nr:jg13530 [Pararge aegeria aegeria]